MHSPHFEFTFFSGKLAEEIMTIVVVPIVTFNVKCFNFMTCYLCNFALLSNSVHDFSWKVADQA